MKKLKVYKCEFDGRDVSCMAVVAAYNKAQARELTEWRLNQLRLRPTAHRMLVEDVLDLEYRGSTPAVILWSHYIEPLCYSEGYDDP